MTSESKYTHESPSPRRVTDFHMYSDRDSSSLAQHHTLGRGTTQASPGSHNHNGVNSPLILAGYQITGSRSDGTALSSLITLLVNMGAADNTNP